MKFLGKGRNKIQEFENLLKKVCKNQGIIFSTLGPVLRNLSSFFNTMVLKKELKVNKF